MNVPHDAWLQPKHEVLAMPLVPASQHHAHLEAGMQIGVQRGGTAKLEDECRQRVLGRYRPWYQPGQDGRWPR